MGKQVNFYMLAEDEIQFLEYVLARPNIKLIRSTSTSPVFEAMDLEALNKAKGSKFYFWNDQLPLENYISGIEENIYSAESAKVIPTGNIIYAIRSGGSAPLIEYIRSSITPKKILSPGRIWAEMYKLSENKTELVYKGEAFENWFCDLAGWLRKNMRREKGIHEYFGIHAIEWFHRGGIVGDSFNPISWEQVNPKK